MRLSFFAAGLASVMGGASPLQERAGGPLAKPIPSTCTVLNVLPHASCGIGNVNGFQPSPTFQTMHLLYEAYFQSTASIEDQWTQCSQQCYGYGNVGQCKAVLLAYNVPVPAGYYGSSGGELRTACVFYDEYLSPNDFVAAPQGQFASETSGSLYCG